MPQRTDDPYPFRVNCAATACATIDSVLRAIPARHRIFEPAVNPVEDFRRPVYVILEGRRIRGAMRKETVKPVPAHCETYTAGRWRRCVAADARQSTPKCAEAVPPSLDRSSRGTAKAPLAEAKRHRLAQHAGRNALGGKYSVTSYSLARAAGADQYALAADDLVASLRRLRIAWAVLTKHTAYDAAQLENAN